MDLGHIMGLGHMATSGISSTVYRGGYGRPTVMVKAEVTAHRPSGRGTARDINLLFLSLSLYIYILLGKLLQTTMTRYTIYVYKYINIWIYTYTHTCACMCRYNETCRNELVQEARWLLQKLASSPPPSPEKCSHNWGSSFVARFVATCLIYEFSKFMYFVLCVQYFPN